MQTKIALTINGQEVEGEITHRSASDINVKITNPYQDVSKGLHIPIFARPYRSFDTELGDEIAKELLESIYRLCTFIFENFDTLTKEYLQIKKRIKHLEIKSVSEWTFKSKRLQLRKLLRSDKINNIEYQKRLTSIRKEYEIFELKKSIIWSGFFAEQFPMVVPEDTKNEVLRLLEKSIRKTESESERSDFKSSGAKRTMSKRVLLGNAYFITPFRGRVIYVPLNHISLVICHPEKFNLNFDYIKTVYEKYGEKIGLEGKARREILSGLIDHGFIRIRKCENFWKVNVKDLYKNAAAIFLYRWAKSMIYATNDFHIEVIIEQRNGEIIKTNLGALSSYRFAGRPKNWLEAASYVPGPFLMIDEVETGLFLP